MSPTEQSIETTTTTTRQFAGMEAVFGTDPDEISVELQAGRPGHIRLVAGHLLYEGDAAHRDHLGPTTPAVRTWAVERITPERVVGRDLDTDEPTEWDRETIERGLAIGTYSTNLTDFERVSVHQVGELDDEAGGMDDREYRYRGTPYVAVVAYGDNGLKYGRRYRFVDDDSSTLALWTQDEPVEHLRDAVADRLNERVRAALEADGYAVAD